MSIFITGLVLFFLPHFYSAARSRADGKDIRAKIGEKKYMGLYSVVTGLGFALIIWGYIKAPDGELLWSGPHELHHYAWVFMIPAMILIMAAYTPLGHIKRTVQHPMMLGVLIWALTHLAMGGDQKRVLLFGSFAAYALISLLFAYKRGTNLKDKPANKSGDIQALVFGLVVFGMIFHGGHQFAFGVPAM